MDRYEFWDKNDDLATAFRTGSGFVILDRRRSGVEYVFCDRNWMQAENERLSDPDGTLFDIAQTLCDNRGLQMTGRVAYPDAIHSFLAANHPESADEFFAQFH